jgi:hypothetical protein
LVAGARAGHAQLIQPFREFRRDLENAVGGVLVKVRTTQAEPFGGQTTQSELYRGLIAGIRKPLSCPLPPLADSFVGKLTLIELLQLRVDAALPLPDLQRET